MTARADTFYAAQGYGNDTATDRVLLWGTGTPLGVVTAGVGSLFMRTDGGSGSTLYVKEAAADTSGWRVAAGTRQVSVQPGGGTSASISADTSGFVYTNGGGAQFAFTLPPAVTGLCFPFVNVDQATYLKVQAAGTDLILLDGGASSAGGSITSKTVFQSVVLVCTSNGSWSQISGAKAADWTVA